MTISTGVGAHRVARRGHLHEEGQHAVHHVGVRGMDRLRVREVLVDGTVDEPVQRSPCRHHPPVDPLQIQSRHPRHVVGKGGVGHHEKLGEFLHYGHELGGVLTLVPHAQRCPERDVHRHVEHELTEIDDRASVPGNVAYQVVDLVVDGGP